MSIKHYFAKNIALPAGDYLQGLSVAREYEFLINSQWWSRSEIDEYQNRQLRMLVEHSVTTVPHYRALFKKLNLKPRDIRTKSDLYKIPVLTKSELQKNGIDLHLSQNYPKSKSLLSSSSGSTGEPLFYSTSKEAYSMNMAANLRGWTWMGYKVGDKFIKLSQNPRSSMLKKLQDKVTSNLYLSTSPLIDSNFKYILDKIEHYRPKVIRCYPDPLQYLAQFRNKSKRYSHTPLAITTTGNTLHDGARAEIEGAFGSKIFDSYSCEGNSNVFECKTHNMYHSSEEYGISEVLNEHGDLITSGVGRLISTDLFNYAHPFIRYDTQDLVELSSEQCTCGRNLLGIKRILGRDSDVLKTISGNHIVHDFTIFFSSLGSSLNKSVDKFQVIRTKSNVVQFNLVVNSRYNSAVENFIKEYWAKKLKSAISINQVADIPLTISGKRKFIIDEGKL
jgi:phenylacetate-CoA ligase